MTSELVGERRERAELAVIPPAISRAEVGEGRVGAVAYPYLVYEAEVTMARPLVGDRTDRFVATVDRSRRLVVRADAFPDAETREVDDVLVLPAELSNEQSRTKAREAVFKWTLRRYSLNDAPDIEFVRDADAYKLFWLVERPDGDVIVDSLQGTEDPLRE
ncbi:hypothetical protein [Haladaptatus salinisoli]|uniref:hypothetical protein n=1 Tax=Haladaptatus salinisoli TaxID=2884876 RepID=UPI001D0A5E26|nr:hypothetical protein [Haladaptatus salinisoli]